LAQDRADASNPAQAPASPTNHFKQVGQVSPQAIRAPRNRPGFLKHPAAERRTDVKEQENIR
jgi:hypothetical protein